MTEIDLELDLDLALSEIPPEFQEIFRQTIKQEIVDSEKNRTDTDTLQYLRQRKSHFKRGGFIRPDGRPGMVSLDPEKIYQQGVPQLGRSRRGRRGMTGGRPKSLLKIGLFVGVALIFLSLIFRGRAQRESEQELRVEATMTAQSAVVALVASETPTLPELTGVEDSLQTIGNLGGALTIGRPSALEINYGSTEETIALAIDPSKPTPKGELRFNESTMLSDNPVAVWLFGTVLNYAIGIPDSLVQNLTLGDRLTITTDTGATLHFVVTESRQGASYEAGRILSQNRLGLTLFALPAGAENAVSFVFASYDFTYEAGDAQPIFQLEEAIPLKGGGSLMVNAVQTGHDENGNLAIVLEGQARAVPGEQTMLLSLVANGEQTATAQLVIAGSNAWQVEFTMPDTVAGLPLLAELRLLPGNVLADDSLVIVALGDVPILLDQVAVALTAAHWEAARLDVVVSGVFTNTGTTAVYLDTEFIQIPIEGGGAYEPNGQATPSLPRQVSPPLPFLLNPGETVGITVTFLPPSPSVTLKINTDLWEIQDIPVEMPIP